MNLLIKKNNSSKWDKIYKESDPEKIPWNFEEIPQWFVDIVESDWVMPCKTLDIGCGLGNYANYLAEKNFSVVGIDYSKEVIKKNKKKFNMINLDFKECDILNLKSLFIENENIFFEFVIDISLLHHIKPKDIKKYIKSLSSVTKNGAKVLISCFSNNDLVFNNKKSFYNPDTKTVTYVRSKDDLFHIFKNDFEIGEYQEIDFGKFSKIGNSLSRKRHILKLIKK